jgi:acyl carrier protein
MTQKQWTKAELAGWLETVLTRELALPIEEVQSVRRFDAMGVDSLLAAYIASELRQRTGRRIDIDEIYDHGDYRTLAEVLGA